MPRTAILFTGQGAQSPGMGKDIAGASKAAADTFEQANAIVGYDLRSLCFDGPADKLEQTDIQQPAIYTTSVAIWRALQEQGEAILSEPPVAMAGLSLGEYTALLAAGSLSFEDGLRLVKRRGELMQQAAQAVPSGMVTTLGLDADAVAEVCRQASSAGLIVPANYNCPGQIVLSGSKAGIEAVIPLIEKAGGRAIPLKVAGAFHSAIMQPAADGLAEMLRSTAFNPPAVPVVANVNAADHEDADRIRLWLTEQLTKPVLWQTSIERLIHEGVERFVEIGPGRVLTGLMRKISRATAITNVSTGADLAQLAGASA